MSSRPSVEGLMHVKTDGAQSFPVVVVVWRGSARSRGHGIKVTASMSGVRTLAPVRGCGSLVVEVSDYGRHVMSFEKRPPVGGVW
ncbi:hypothetical protein TNCV_4705121 [Trichonephila clavipes]|nr:hypothetical protein TNCV_4705121 [Trichonephila clavipes]